ncbi:hypothetical protein [Leisingera daeponensis]|uniref:hypothetical protein n=1 Tax=Leisingera daeponensis TaxID=405746 RepID=UPI001C96C49E|nr:hypothetical protein [Leisingera daeponensis]MBY6058173.1 hypothetical protein [Leisingera daeponensis]
MTKTPIVSDRLNIQKLRLHLNSALGVIERRYQKHPTNPNRAKINMAKNVVEAVTQTKKPCESIVRSLSDVANGHARVDDDIAVPTKYYQYKLKSTRRNHIRNFCRLVMYYAWCEKDVLFPAAFKMRQAVTLDMRENSPSRVLQEISRFEPTSVDIKKHGIYIRQWMREYSLSWIYCTDWIEFSDIDVEEAGRLHAFMSHHNSQNNGNPSSVGKAFEVFVDRRLIKLKIKDFERAKADAIEDFGPEEVGAAELTAFTTPRKRTEKSHFFIHPQLEVEGISPPSETIQIWDRLFGEYIIHRENTGRSANEGRKKSFYVFADYLSIALPMFGRNPSERINIPGSPKEFTRYPFIDQTMRPRAFPTFPDYLKKRGLAASTRQSHLYVLKDFFEWVETSLAFKEFSDIAGPGFRSPLHVRDFPFVPRPSGTTKVPFTEEVYPLLFHYAYEVERIGMYLEARPEIAQEICKFSNQASNFIIDLHAVDMEFNIVHQDEVFRVSRIPQRLVVGSARAGQGINLSVLRLLIFILETGLRAQTGQWLDKDRWSKHLHKFDDSEPIKMIHANTDKPGKVKDIRVLSRVVSLLERQRDHLASKSIPAVEVDYEERPSSPFDPVVPLFAKENGEVWSDGSYSDTWADLLFGLQGFLYENGVETRQVIEIKPPEEHEDGKVGRNGLPYCELNWTPVHTPHSARSSFVTRRAGSTEYVILAELIGHDDPIVTAYYDVAELETIIDVLRKHERPTLDVTSPVSGLRAQLTSADRVTEDVIRRFCINSLHDAHGEEDRERGASGVDLLKASQVSELVFRETHICPVGELCPDEVVLAAGGPMRCGTCKLACKSVDHLPAIEAKCRALTARIQHTSAALRKEKQGHRDQTRQRQLQRDLMADSYQLVGWQDAAVTLRRLLAERESEGVVTGSPEIIKRHLRHVVRQVRPAQFIAERILDAKMYPSMSDEILQRQAQRLARQLAMSETEIYADENEEVLAIYSLISSRLKAAGKTWDEAGEILEKQVGSRRLKMQPPRGLPNART